jgi:glutathione synthase/RimK-type ligase-like ATP-grasp enzyme
VKIALVTAAQARDLDQDLPPLRAALERRGVRAEPIVWDDAAARWAEWDAAVVRSTWDYAPRRDAFVAWARALPVRLINAPDVLAWNTDKRYLAELAARGVPITPTTWIGPSDEEIDLPAGEIVVKPAVSAGARDTARYGAGERDAARAHVQRLVSARRVAMVQPYQSAVDEHGETGLVFFGGTFSHAIRKAPILRRGAGLVEGLFATEDIQPRAPSAKERAVAEAVLDAVPAGRASLAYARVDLVKGDHGDPLLLELELTEPSVFLRHAEGSADRLAAAILERVSPGGAREDGPSR